MSENRQNLQVNTVYGRCIKFSDVVMCTYEGNVACFTSLHGNVCILCGSNSSDIWLPWQICCDYPSLNRQMSWPP